MRLSVVIPVYNGEKFIADCLRTVRRETLFTESEIICVDDASTDNSAEIVRADFPNVAVMRSDSNAGFASTCNRGMAQATGEYILLLNQDTLCQSGAVCRLLERLERDKSIGFIGPKFVGFDGQLQKKCAAFPTFANLFYKFFGFARLYPNSERFAALTMSWFDHDSEMFVDQPMGAALLFRKSLLDSIGPLDESFPIFFNDVDWAKRAVEAGFQNLYFPEAVIEHYVGSATRPQKPRMVRESHRSLYHYLKKWNSGAKNVPALLFWKVLLYVSGILRSLYWRIRG